MHYFGGKTRIAKPLSEFLLNKIDGHKYYLEPFVGGGSVLEKIYGVPRIASDKNEYLICMYKALQKGWTPPKNVTEEEYKYVRNNKDENKKLTGFIGFGCSYAGKFFGGYARNKRGDNYSLQTHNSLMKQLPYIQSVSFKHQDYRDFFPKNHLIYCDPPYKNTTAYSTGKFDHNEFWETIRKWSEHNSVFVSEYIAPEDFECVWEYKTYTEIRNGNNERDKRVERLFQYIG